ncbi:acyltransferase, partial [Latilactobacillus curvatus]|uniref:acyltransferase n=1 Tax=Latilactobacillus curvatus TaxID=28038 RepID=UPI0020C7D1A4
YFIRVIAMGAVIFIHVSDGIEMQQSLNSQIIKEVVESLVLLCNPLFFMISGHFNLHFKGTSRSDYKRYYLKKLFNVVIPLVIYQFMFYCFTNYLTHQQMGIKLWGWRLILDIFQDYTTNYFWFMYPLIAYLIAAPFLSKMLENLTDKEETIFTWVLIIVQTSGWLLKLININWGLISFPFSNWLIYFLLGRLLEKKWNVIPCMESGLIIGMVVVINVILTVIFPQSKGWGLHDLSPMYLLLAVVVYQGILRSTLCKKMSNSKLVVFLAHYSYGVYLGHGIVLLLITPYLRFSSGILSIIVTFFVAYLISVMFAILIDSLIIKQEKRILLRKF